MALETLGQAILRLIWDAAFPITSKQIENILKSIRNDKAEIEQKIEQAISSLQTSAELISDLEKILSDKKEKLEKLKTEYDKYDQLSEISKEKSKLIISEIESTINKSAGKERVISFAINIIAGLIIFVLGIILSKRVTELLSGII